MPIGNHVRQWIPLVGGTCDMRIGSAVVDEMGSILKGSVGRPHACALVLGSAVSDALAERIRRQMVDAGFVVHFVGLVPDCSPCTLEATTELARGLERAHITSDDLIIAVGDEVVLSAVSSVAGVWCGSTPVAVVPCTLPAALTIPTPRGIDVNGVDELIATRACARYAICDAEELALDETSFRLACAQMAVAAMCDSERSFSALWDRADALASKDVAAICEQLAASTNSRGRVASSSAVATNQSITYGRTFARALTTLAPDVEPGVALAEGLRFSARLAAGMHVCSVDDVLTQDELLDMLGIGAASCSIEPSALIAALKEERFRRTNRFLLELPRAIGRVRLASIDDELLIEHAHAFCASRVG